MNILITGATGFIGRRVARTLIDHGHVVTGAVRNPAVAAQSVPGLHCHPVDFNAAATRSAWAPLFPRAEADADAAPYDVVINAVGILQQTRRQRFHAVHHAAPVALFDACVQSGVRRIVQISALGADAEARSEYHRSKRAADDYLRHLPIEHVIVQPALVFGKGGTSARLFSTLARLPVIPLPGNGEQRVQPVHVNDVVQSIVTLVETPELPASTVPLVGPIPMTLRKFYSELRRAQGIASRPLFLPVPMMLMRVVARIGNLVPGAMLDSDTLEMLNRGNTADPALVRLLLQRDPRPVARFFDD